MRPPHVVLVTGAAALAVLMLWHIGAQPSRAQPPGADASGAGIHLTSSIDNIRADPPGDRTPNYLMTFSHAAQLSGDYSINVEGAEVTSGQAVAGFILGCAVSVAGGVTVGLAPNQGLAASITPIFIPPSDTVSPEPTTSAASTTAMPSTTTAMPSTTTAMPSTTTAMPSTAAAMPSTAAAIPGTAAAIPGTAAAMPSTAAAMPSTAAAIPGTAAAMPSTTAAIPGTTAIPGTAAAIPGATAVQGDLVSPPILSLGPSVAGTLGLTEELGGTLGPGEVTTATTATANLDERNTFPYHIIFNNAALNISQCASPVSAVPFVTATVGTPGGTVQTTAYGTQFTF
ncbi:hypothetical protein GFY24_10030 [Nocardia sp. SYP-A9097]|uniref:MspA family porin n=1 Tax=Nocardia sp. SYP-A9097 TaxID=2663237 RepID=UPI00129AE179|nr:MspA family porin [Nocardia sp. SYP-A9097]MRH87785.1 hypothetical protein [Nocardia sp. SYP-A9097]